MTEELKVVLMEKAVNKDGKKYITCLEAHTIAKEMALEPKEVGKVANILKIKITSCQLGCFP